MARFDYVGFLVKVLGKKELWPEKVSQRTDRVYQAYFDKYGLRFTQNNGPPSGHSIWLGQKKSEDFGEPETNSVVAVIESEAKIALGSHPRYHPAPKDGRAAGLKHDGLVIRVVDASFREMFERIKPCLEAGLGEEVKVL